MKTSAIIIGSFALIAAFSLPAQARVDYYDGARSQVASASLNGNINVGASPAVIQSVPGRAIEFARDKDGRWWPSKSLSR